MIGPLGGASIYSGDAAFRAFNAGDRILARANRVTGNETPAELFAINQADKRDALIKIREEINYQVDEVRNAARQEQAKKAQERARQRIANGWIF